MDEPTTTEYAVAKRVKKVAPRRPTEGAQLLGQRAEFALFYYRHVAGMIRFVMRLGATPHEAADAVHTAFTEAFPRWAQITAPNAWLRTVATRSYLRQTAGREHPTALMPDLPGDASPLEAVTLKEEEQRVYTALASLPPRQRHVMAWHLDGFTHSEIATALGTTPEAVRQNYARARAALKHSLGLASKEGR
ncbi:RNA polymerase sigma factor [Streptomyces indiaensis]|uniref:SigE family RNA polymerase sigma factor n=1 Tax=Streptomyces indiaensis TaxID=284033 RepID=A0ABN3DNZ2_9ACTN|nr:sigma-70 family RNA polymerase sigma factor [Streptomyces indiaensis]MCF1646022.1 sigma-70 family RNA polymerase sigma factor [Streptomyces indiaensis]